MKDDDRSYIHNFYSWKKKAWKKKSGLYGIRTLDLCDTGAALYQLNSAVRIIWFSYIQNFIKKTLIHFITSTNIQQLLDEVEQNRDILR